MATVKLCDITHESSYHTEVVSIKEMQKSGGMKLESEPEDRLEYSIVMKSINGNNIQDVSTKHICERVMKLCNARLNQLRDGRGGNNAE